MKSNDKTEVLLVEDDADDYILFKEYFSDIQGRNYHLTWADTFEKAITEISSGRYDVYIYDYLLGAKTGLDLIRFTLDKGIEAPIILLTGLGSHEVDIKAMEMGAADYLVKGEMDAEKLERSIRYSVEQNNILKKLKASEKKFRSIFENSYDVIYVSNQHGDILDINKSGERLFGYSIDELRKMNASQLYENPAERIRFLDAINRTGSFSNFEVILKDKFGNRKICTLTANLQRIDEKGNVYYQGIVHDMTRRRKAEQDLMIAEKLAVTGRLARTLAHEVRNPLTNINLAVEQLEEDVNTEESKSYFDIIRRNSKRINDLVTQLMENSRPAEISSEKISLHSILNKTLSLATDRAALKNIKLEKRFGPDISLRADESKLVMALLNIVINAIEAVESESGVITISSDCKDKKCFIIIEDNGSGMTKEEISSIFEPYFTGKESGMGLGLVTSHSIIRTHNGAIEVESEVNKGSRFQIVLDIV
jgi:PAS domain S-box-containing protein